MTELKNIFSKAKAAQTGWPFWFIGGFMFLLLSCGGNSAGTIDDSKVIAEVGEFSLTEKMLNKTFPKGWDLNSPQIKDYIRIWTEQKVVALEAMKTLSVEERDFSQEMMDYEGSLLKYTYERKLLDTALTTEVNDEELKAYFNANQKNFELKENIVRVRYVKVPKKHKKLSQIKYLLQYKDSVQKEKFFNLIQKEKIFCVADDSAWIKLDELKSLVPFKLYNDEHFLRHYKYTEAPEGDDVWVVYFTANRLKEGVAPLEMVEDQIKAILVNQRKNDLIQKNQKDLYEKAQRSGALKIFID